MQNSILEWVVYLFYFCFMNNKCAIYKFWIFEFWIYFIFKYSDIGLLWSKITIFMIGITLKLILHTKYRWNNPETGWAWKVQNITFLPFLALKFIAYTNIQIHVTGSSITINNNWNYQKTADYCRTVPLMYNW